MTITMFNVLDVVQIVNPELEDDGLELNQNYIIAKVQAFPISQEDPYTQRVKLFVQRLNEAGDGVEGSIYVVDPASVEHTGMRAVENASSD